MKNLLKKEHQGVGGLYFLMVNLICSCITIIALNLSWGSQVIAMADNIAHIVSLNVAVQSYIGNHDPYSGTNIVITNESGSVYNPLSDFNSMATSSGFAAAGASTCEISWDGDKATVQMGGFTTSLGTTIVPHIQNTVIEDF